MGTESARERRVNRQGNAAFVSIVVISYVILILNLPRAYSLLEMLVLAGLGVVYTAVGVLGMDVAQRKGLFWLYFPAEIVLASVLVVVSGSRGQLWLLPLPVVSQAAMALPRRWMLVVCALVLVVLVVLVAPLAVDESVASIMPAAIGFTAALAFVVMFSRIAANEYEARAEVQRLADQLGEANRKLSAYSVQAGDLAAMQERNRLARDIHDGLGHYLTVISVQLQVARAMLDGDRERSRDAIEKAQALTQQALADVRRSVAALRASPLDGRSLAAAIAGLTEEQRSAGIITEVAVAGSPRPLSPQADLTPYRVAQEALTNVRKHARASRTDLTLHFSRAHVVGLVIRDNGVGAQATEQGFGLLGLRERVQLLGGTMAIGTAEGAGFGLAAEVAG